MRLIKSCRIFTALAVLASVVFFVGIAGSQEPGKDRTKNLQTYVLSSFEKAEDWTVEFSQYTAKVFEAGKGWVQDNAKNQLRGFEGKPWGLDFPHIKGESRVIGIKASFDRKGYNYIIVRPKAPIPMEGLVSEIDLWVWGGNFKYKLELQLIDYKGFEHTLDAGWLNFTGWRNIRIKIPEWIPQGEQYIPRLKTLRFKAFKLLAHPAERSDVYYVYFDRMQIQTDVYLSRFDGDELVKKAPEDWMPKQKTLLGPGETNK